MLRIGSICTIAALLAIGIVLLTPPSVAAKLALNEEELDGITASGEPTVIVTGDENSTIDYTSEPVFTLGFSVPEAQVGITALTIQNVVGELQLLVNLNVLSALNEIAGTEQRNFSMQSWGATLPIADTVKTVAGVAAAPCLNAGSCVTKGGAGGDAGSNLHAGAGGNADSSEGGPGGAGAPSGTLSNLTAGVGGVGGSSSPATSTGNTGGTGGTGGAGAAGAGGAGGAGPGGGGGGGGGGASGGSANGGNGTGVAVTGDGGDGGNGGSLTASTGNAGNAGNGGNAAAAPGGNGGSASAPAGSGGNGAPVVAQGNGATSPGLISQAASASGDLIIHAGDGAQVNAVDQPVFTLGFTASQAQKDLAALFVSNVVGRSQFALNLNIASASFTTIPFATNPVEGNVGTVKQVNTGIQFRGTPLTGSTTIGITHTN
jgi:hypothetical protein